MIGLIKKDLLMIKSNLKLVGVIFLVFFIMALQGEVDISFVPALISVMLFMSTFSYDEYNKWDAYAITLPNGRKNIVKSKYLATLILIVTAIVITILMNIVVGIINNSLDCEEIISVMTGCCFGIIAIQSIFYPLIFKYGIEKGRIGLFVGTFGIVGIIGLLSKTMKINVPSNIMVFFNNYWLIITAIILFIILLCSYKISEKIYMKKEF